MGSLNLVKAESAENMLTNAKQNKTKNGKGCLVLMCKLSNFTFIIIPKIIHKIPLVGLVIFFLTKYMMTV